MYNWVTAGCVLSVYNSRLPSSKITSIRTQPDQFYTSVSLWPDMMHVIGAVDSDHDGSPCSSAAIRTAISSPSYNFQSLSTLGGCLFFASSCGAFHGTIRLSLFVVGIKGRLQADCFFPSSSHSSSLPPWRVHLFRTLLCHAELSSPVQSCLVSFQKNDPSADTLSSMIPRS